MAIATEKAAGAKETVRQKRERDQELLVWPDLVFIEFSGQAIKMQCHGSNVSALVVKCSWATAQDTDVTLKSLK